MHAYHAHFVAQHLERTDDVVFHAPRGGGGSDLIGGLIWWFEAFVDEGQDTLRFQRATR